MYRVAGEKIQQAVLSPRHGSLKPNNKHCLYNNSCILAHVSVIIICTVCHVDRRRSAWRGTASPPGWTIASANKNDERPPGTPPSVRSGTPPFDHPTPTAFTLAAKSSSLGHITPFLYQNTSQTTTTFINAIHLPFVPSHSRSVHRHPLHPETAASLPEDRTATRRVDTYDHTYCITTTVARHGGRAGQDR